MTVHAEFHDDQRLRVGETDFFCAYPLHTAPDGMLAVMKNRPMVEQYLELARDLEPRVIVELGIHRGGSTALLAELNRPDLLVALEISETPPPALMDHIADRDLGGVVHAHFGVDQSDRETVAAVVDAELGGRRIDAVIDDASHRYAETLASFEVLFPRIREGGVFVLEDWNGDHRLADGIVDALHDETNPFHADTVAGIAHAAANPNRDDHPELFVTPFVQLVVEFVLARASAGDAIREVTIDDSWITVRRGADPLGADFRLADLVQDHYGFTAFPDGPRPLPGAPGRG